MQIFNVTVNSTVTDYGDI